MRITPIDIQDQRFRVTFRGFDPVEVDAFLQRVADELERVSQERDALRAEAEKERKTRNTLEEALAAARTLQEGILERARGEAEIVVNQAQIKADRILGEANEELLRLRRDIQHIRERKAIVLAEFAAVAQAARDWIDQKQAAEGQPLPPFIAEEGSAEGGAVGPGFR